MTIFLLLAAAHFFAICVTMGVVKGFGPYVAIAEWKKTVIFAAIISLVSALIVLAFL